MENDVYDPVAQCLSYVKNGSQYKHKQPLPLFTSRKPPKFEEMDILGLPPGTTQENPYVIVMTDRLSKSTRAVPTSKRGAAQVADILLDNWIVPFGILNYVLASSGPKFERNIFATFSGNLHPTSNSFYQQTNGDVER